MIKVSPVGGSKQQQFCQTFGIVPPVDAAAGAGAGAGAGVGVGAGAGAAAGTAWL